VGNMYSRKKQIIEIPKLKQSETQGKIGYQYLEIIDKKPFRKISDVRKEFKPVVIDDKKERAQDSPRLLRSFQKQTSTPKGTEKLFDSEYCRLRDFLDAFDFVATLGSRTDEEITLTYFGSKLLNLCREKGVKDRLRYPTSWLRCLIAYRKRQTKFSPRDIVMSI